MMSAHVMWGNTWEMILRLSWICSASFLVKRNEIILS